MPSLSRPFSSRKSPKHNQERITLWGIHATQAAWRNPKRRCFRLMLMKERAAQWQPLLEEARQEGLSRPQPIWVERATLEVALPDGAVHQGCVLEVAPLDSVSLETLCSALPHLLVVLDHVSDPHNVGAIMRSATAFGAGGVIMTDRHAPPVTGVLAKAAAGGIEHTPLVRVPNLARALDMMGQAGAWRVGFAHDAPDSIGSQSFPEGSRVLVFGSEGEGLRRLTRTHCDALVSLPTHGVLPSLNVSNAAALGLYLASRKI